MRRHAFPAIVGAIVALLVIVMVFLLLGLQRFTPVIATTTLGSPANPPDLPVSTVLEEPSAVEKAAPAHVLTEAEIASAWSEVARAASEGKWQAWGQVVDADTGEVLFSADATGLHTPASTQKVLTAAFALATLDPAATLTTGLSFADSDLYLWGEGDLLLGSEQGQPSRTNGHAGLADLAEQAADALKAAGTTSVTLHYQQSLFDGPLRNPAWTDQGVTDYAGDVGPFAIDTGRVAPEAWEFQASSALVVAQTLAAELAADGIAVVDVVPGSVPEDAHQIAAVESSPIIDQLQYMVVTSDNTLAEQYCHLATAATDAESVDFQTSGVALKDFTIGSGVDAQNIVVADCSGLDSNSRLTAEVLTQTILGSAAAQDARSSLVRIFPVAGMNGTLESRFMEDPTRGNVNAKTGSLGHVSTLAGILTTESGQNLVFAVGADEVPDDGAYWVKHHLDDFVEFLAQS